MALLAPTSRVALRSALESLSTIGAGNVQVYGTPASFRLHMTGEMGAQALPMADYPLSANGSTLIPPATLAVTQLDEGAAPMLTALAAQLDIEYSNITNERLRFLLLKRDLLDALLGESQRGVDTDINGADEKLSQQHDNLLKLRRLVQSEIDGLTAAGGAADTAPNAFTPVVGKIAKTTPNGLPYGYLGLGNDGRFR